MKSRELLQSELSQDLQVEKKLFERLNRYAGGKQRSLENASLLENHPSFELEDTLLVRRIKSCGNYLEFNNYHTVNKTTLHYARFCTSALLCPLCAMRRGSKYVESYKERIAFVRSANKKLRLSMLTFTVKNGEDLRERFNHLQNSIRRLVEHRRKFLNQDKRRSFNEFCKVDGWVGSYEVTNIGNGWHPHAHVLVLHDTSFDYKRMLAEWEAITNDSCIMNVQAVKGNPDEAFVEVFKYALKFTDLSAENNVDAFYALRGKRMVFNGGSLWGVKVPEKLEDSPLEDLPFIRLFYKYFDGAYQLKDSVQHTDNYLRTMDRIRDNPHMKLTPHDYQDYLNYCEAMNNLSESQQIKNE